MSQAATKDGAQLEERLDAVEAQHEIHRLVSDYCHGVDKNDEARFLSIWHSDAEWLIGEPFGDFRGKEEIRHCLVDLIWPAFDESHHWTTNLAVDVDGDTATGVCDVWSTGTVAATPVFIAATYYDDFERRDGSWAISRRSVDMYYFSAVDRPWNSEPRISPPTP